MKPRGLAETRKFDGKTYYSYGYVPTKTEAMKLAASLRRQLGGARTTKSGKRWTVWGKS